MNVKLQILIIVVAVVFLGLVANLLKKKKIDFRYALGWLALEAIIVVLTLFPKSLEWLSVQMGIASPVNMLFFFGFCLALCMIFILSMAISHANDKIKKLAQEIAILKKSIYDTQMLVTEEKKKK